MGDDQQTLSWQHLTTLFVAVILICSLLVIATHWLMKDRISNNAREYRFRMINEVLSVPYNNRIHDDLITINDPGYFYGDHDIHVFRARQDGNPVAAVFMPVQARGYSGLIRLIISIDYNGNILSVRALDHHETEGLGDQIDISRSDWIRKFDHLSLTGTGTEDWTLSTDGGKFDQISGATITSRGVMNTVHKTLEYYLTYRDKLYMQ